MRKHIQNCEQIKNEISALIGQNIKLSVNKGRKKIIRYNAIIVNAFPKVFTVKVIGDKLVDKLSCSYNDIICGDVRVIKK